MHVRLATALCSLLACAPLFGSCAPEDPPGTFAGLDEDYVLSTAEPAYARTTPLRLRYEDDWVPRTCEGVTYLTPQDHIVIEWRCRFATSPTTNTTAISYITGGLSDDDGDGTYTGTLIGLPLNPDDTIAMTPVAGEFTLTPM